MMRDTPPKHASFQFTSDTAFALVGCGLAAASASFGIYMSVRGPSPSLGTSGDFTVFAQLAPRGVGGARPHVPKKTEDDLDFTATASIPKNSRSDIGPVVDHDREDANTSTSIVPGIVLQAAGTDAAEVAVDGRLQRVRVGDLIEGAGTVIAIYPGAHPMLKTTRGLVVP